MIRYWLAICYCFIAFNAHAKDIPLLKCLPHHPKWCVNYAIKPQNGSYVLDIDQTRSAPLDKAEMQDVMSHLAANPQSYRLYDTEDTALELIYTGNAGQAREIIDLALSGTIIDKGAVFIGLINHVRRERYGSYFLAMSGIK